MSDICKCCRGNQKNAGLWASEDCSAKQSSRRKAVRLNSPFEGSFASICQLTERDDSTATGSAGISHGVEQIEAHHDEDAGNGTQDTAQDR